MIFDSQRVSPKTALESNKKLMLIILLQLKIYGEFNIENPSAKVWIISWINHYRIACKTSYETKKLTKELFKNKTFMYEIDCYYSVIEASEP